MVRWTTFPKATGLKLARPRMQLCVKPRLRVCGSSDVACYASRQRLSVRREAPLSDHFRRRKRLLVASQSLRFHLATKRWSGLRGSPRAAAVHKKCARSCTTRSLEVRNQPWLCGLTLKLSGAVRRPLERRVSPQRSRSLDRQPRCATQLDSRAPKRATAGSAGEAGARTSPQPGAAYSQGQRTTKALPYSRDSNRLERATVAN
jgi:hypothetical protein